MMIIIVMSDYYYDFLWCSMSMSNPPEGMFVCKPHENYEAIYLRLSTIDPNYGSCKMYVNQL